MIDHLSAALGGVGPAEARGAAALRLRCELQPAAGAGARVLPPTYKEPRGDASTYVKEQRQIEGAPVDCVLLDSVASQSNRLEEALLELMAAGGVAIPDIVVDQAEFGRNSALRMSHRLFDAWVEDAHLNEVRFGETPLYDELASVINRGVALPLVERFPVGLILGCWASRKTNPQGTTRIARAITSEIIAIDTIDGTRSSSKTDLHHVSAGIKLAEGDDGARFRVLEGSAVPKGTKLVGRGAKKDGRPAVLGYGNVTPTVNHDHGGITMRRAEQHTIVSLAALRATRPARMGADGRDPELELATRLALATLAVTMLEAQVDLGWELRSGCHLVPVAEPTLELVGRLGDTVASWPLLELNGPDLLRETSTALGARGLDWSAPPLELTASDEQLQLLRLSLNQSDASDEG